MANKLQATPTYLLLLAQFHGKVSKVITKPIIGTSSFISPIFCNAKSPAIATVKPAPNMIHIIGDIEVGLTYIIGDVGLGLAFCLPSRILETFFLGRAIYLSFQRNFKLFFAKRCHKTCFSITKKTIFSKRFFTKKLTKIIVCYYFG